MTGIYTQLYGAVQTALTDLQQSGDLPQELNTANVTVELARDPAHGDFATNAAMVLAKQAKMNPRAIGEKLAEKLAGHNHIAAAEVAGPGFVNLKLASERFHEQLRDIIDQGEAYGRSTLGAGQKALVEFVSINPTGPIHVGHGRNAVLGDVICRLLANAGYDVWREYLVNDAGNQIRSLVLSVVARYRTLFDEPLQLPEDGYQGEYIIDIAEKLKQADGDKWLGVTDEDMLTRELRAFCVTACMDMIRASLNNMGIAFDRFFSEYEMHQDGSSLDEALKALREKGYVYEGVLPPPKGKEVADYEAVELTLFKATAFGEEQDKAIFNRRGEVTYFGQDIAYHWDKLKRGFDWLVTVIAGQQMGNFTPLLHVMQALTARDDALTPFYHGLVKTLREGQPVKLSKRAGNIIMLDDVLAEVGVDSYRYWMLTRKADTELVFDLAKAVEKNNDNPVFYVQYAHARMCSLFRQAEEKGLPPLDVATADLSLLDDPFELEMMRTLSVYPMVAERAAATLEPHRLANFAQELAGRFHQWYNAGKFLDADNMPKTHARLALVLATRQVLANLLGLMGVGTPEKM